MDAEAGPVPDGWRAGTFALWAAGAAGAILIGMENDESNRVQAGRGHLERRRGDGVFGGVCAGIARYLGIDVLLIRITVCALVLVSGGAVTLAYLLAWILVPPAAEEQWQPVARPDPLAGDGSARVDVDARDAWNAAGGELRSLAAGLRPVDARRTDSDRRERSRTAAVDAALTKLGDRLRDPEVRAGARRTATSLSTAVGAGVDGVGRHLRRDSTSARGDDTAGDGSTR